MNGTQDTVLWSYLSEKSRHIETGMDALTRKRTESYYTNLKLTDVMMGELVEHLKADNQKKQLYEYRFWSPALVQETLFFHTLRLLGRLDLTRKRLKLC